MADTSKALNLHVATSTDDKGLKQAATSLGQVEKATEVLTQSTTQATGATVKLDTALESLGASGKNVATTKAVLSSETDKATKSTNGFGNAALSAAFFVDDLQYGVKGILNNIPQLTLALGAGSGVAGVISILAVGFSVLSTNMGWFDDKAEETGDNLKKLAQDTRNAAGEAAYEASQLNIAREAMDRHNDALQTADDNYKKLADSIDAAAQAREAMNRNILAETDAEAALQLAKIEQLRLNGTITDQQAEQNSLTVKRGADEKRYATEREESLAKERDLRTKADAESRRLQEKDVTTRDIGNDSRFLLTNADRKAAEARLKAAQAQANLARQNLDSTNPYLIVPSADGEGTEQIPNPDYQQAQQNLKKAGQEIGNANRPLDRDAEARARTGFTSAEARDKELERLNKERQAQREEANRMQRAADLERQRRESIDRIRPMTLEQTRIESSNRITGFDRRDQEAAETARQKAEQERRRDIGGEGSNLVKMLKDRGLQAPALNKLVGALDDVKSGEEGSEARLASVLDKVTSYFASKKNRDAELDSRLQKLENQLKEGRNNR